MARRCFPLLTCLALLAFLGCRETAQEEPLAEAAVLSGAESFDEAKEAAQSAYRATESFEEKLAIAGEFLERYPDTDDTPSILGMVGRDALKAENPDAVFELARSTLERIKDADNRFQVRLQLAGLYGRAGRQEELRALVSELGEARDLRYRDHYAIIEAALEAEDWELAVEHSDASLAYASPAHYKEDSPELSDAEAQEAGTRRVAYSLAYKGWAQFNLGHKDAAFESFRRAKESTDYNLLGLDATPLHSYWGRALLAGGEAEEAMEVLATEALFGRDKAGYEAYRQAYAACHEDEDGFEEHLWAMRRREAREVPDFTLANYDGQDVSLSGFQGDVVLLAFWFPT